MVELQGPWPSPSQHWATEAHVALTSLHRRRSEFIQILLHELTPYPVPFQSSIAGIPALCFLSSCLTSVWSLRGAAEAVLRGLGSAFSRPVTLLMLILNDAFSGCSHQRNPAGQGCVCLRNQSAACCERLSSPPSGPGS